MMTLYKNCLVLKLLFFLPIVTLTNFKNLNPSSLDGTINPVYQNYHQVFRSTEKATGFVRLNNGFTVLPNSTAYLDIFMTVSGAMDLRETGTLQLLSDLNLDSGFTLSSGGYIKGTGHTISLNNNLTIPENKTLSFNGDTIIEGNGNTLYLDNYAKIFIDSNITLTLKNLTLKTKHNIPLYPALKLNGTKSKFCLNNVILNPTENLYFSEGQFFIHNDVIFSGSSAFIYESTQNSYITPHSTFKFDPNTTFSYTPTTTFNKDLIVLSDKTSTLYFDGSNLNATLTGMRLTRGSVILENNVNLNIPKTYSATGFSASPINAPTWGTGSMNVLSVAWNPKNNLLAACGSKARGGVYTALYNYTGSALNLLSGDSTWPVVVAFYGPYQCGWSPDGRYLIVAGIQRTRIYDVTAGNLSNLIQTKTFSNTVLGADFSPDGNYVALQTTSDIQIFNFNNGNLGASAIATINWTSPPQYSPPQPGTISWKPNDPQYLIANGPSFGIFKFDQNKLETITTLNVGEGIYAATWSPDGKYISVGTGYSAKIYLYEFSDKNLHFITQINGLSAGLTGICQSIKIPITWNVGQNKVLITAFSDVSSLSPAAYDFKMYKFDQGKLGLLTQKKYGTAKLCASINKDGSVVALGGMMPTNGYQVQAYKIINALTPTSLSNSINFGDSSLNSDYNLDVKVLGNSKIKITGIINDDSI